MSSDSLADELGQELDDDDVVPCSPGHGDSCLQAPWTLLKGLHQNGHQSSAGHNRQESGGGDGEKGLGGGFMSDVVVEGTGLGPTVHVDSGGSGDKVVAGVSLPLVFMEEDEAQDHTLGPTTTGNSSDVLLPMVIPPPVRFASSPVTHADLHVGDDGLGGGTHGSTIEDFGHLKGANGHLGQRGIGHLQESDPTDQETDVANIASSALLLSELNKTTPERYGRETDRVLSSSAQREEEIFSETQADIFDSQVVEDALSATTAEMIPILQAAQDPEHVMESESLHLRLSLSAPTDLSDAQSCVVNIKSDMSSEKPNLDDSDTDLDDSVQILDERPKRKSVEVISSSFPKRVRVADEDTQKSVQMDDTQSDQLCLRYMPTQDSQYPEAKSETAEESGKEGVDDEVKEVADSSAATDTTEILEERKKAEDSVISVSSGAEDDMPGNPLALNIEVVDILDSGPSASGTPSSSPILLQLCPEQFPSPLPHPTPTNPRVGRHSSNTAQHLAKSSQATRRLTGFRKMLYGIALNIQDNVRNRLASDSINMSATVPSVLEDTGDLQHSNSGGLFIRNSTPNPPPTLEPASSEPKKSNPSIGCNPKPDVAHHFSPIEAVGHSTPNVESDTSSDLTKEKTKEECNVSKTDTEVLSESGSGNVSGKRIVVIEFTIKIKEEDGAVLLSHENVRRLVRKDVAESAAQEFERRVETVSPGGYSADVSSASKSTSSSSKGRLSQTLSGNIDDLFELPRARHRPSSVLAKTQSPIGRHHMRRPVTFAQKAPRLNLAVSTSTDTSSSPPRSPPKKLVEAKRVGEGKKVGVAKKVGDAKRLSNVEEKQETPVPAASSKVEKVKEEKPEEKTEEVEQVELETQWRPLAPGIQVFAKWQDHYFYPGKICEQGKQDTWNVSFSDGKYGPVRDSNIVPVEVLKRGQAIYALLQEDEYLPGYIVSHQRRGNDLLYEVSLEDKSKRLLPRQKLALHKDQAQYVRDSAFPASPSISSRIVDVSLENIVQGKRKRIAPKKPQTPVRQQQLDPNLDPSEQSDSEVTTSRGKGRGKGKSSLGGRGTPSKSSPAPRGRGKRKRLDMSEDDSGSGPGLKKKKVADEASSTPKVTLQEIVVDEQKMGPLPKSKIFSGKAFLLSKPEVVQHEWDKSSQCSSDYSDYLSSTGSALSSPGIAAQDLPFVKSYVCRQLVSGGGTVLDTFDELQAWTKGERILISNTHSTSVNYLLCLAAGFAPVSYKWVIDCCCNNRLLPYKRNLLPSGYSLDTKDLVEWRSNSKGVMEGLRFLAVSENRDGFCQVWKQVLLAANARRVDIQENHTFKKAHLDNVDMVLTDESHPHHLVGEAKLKNLPVVTSLWVIQSLVQGKQVLIASDERYKLTVNQSDSSN